jgi:S-adenosylmethionine/arginine decarboxylase-like enzyme
MPDGEVQVCDLGGVPKAILRDQDEMVKQLIEICETAGLTVLDDVSHTFRSGGKGFTFVLLLVESHLAIHTWPEDEYLALTLDTCWGQTITTEVIEAVLELLPHESATVETVPRARAP